MTPPHTISVFVVDDLASMRERLRELLDDMVGVTIAGDAGNLEEAAAGILRTRPDCVLLDYQIEGGTGVQLLHAVRPQSPRTEFIVLTNHATDQHRRACLAAGARFFLDKSAEFGCIGAAIGQIERLRTTSPTRAAR